MTGTRMEILTYFDWTLGIVDAINRTVPYELLIARCSQCGDIAYVDIMTAVRVPILRMYTPEEGVVPGADPDTLRIEMYDLMTRCTIQTCALRPGPCVPNVLNTRRLHFDGVLPTFRRKDRQLEGT
jgi:hypothetical protein